MTFLQLVAIFVLAAALAGGPTLRLVAGTTIVVAMTAAWIGLGFIAGAP